MRALRDLETAASASSLPRPPPIPSSPFWAVEPWGLIGSVAWRSQWPSPGWYGGPCPEGKSIPACWQQHGSSPAPQPLPAPSLGASTGLSPWLRGPQEGLRSPGEKLSRQQSESSVSPLKETRRACELHQRRILALLKGPRRSQYKNTKSPISLIIIKNPKNGKLRGQGRGPWARGTGSPARGTRPGLRAPWYCCCYEVGEGGAGIDCPVEPPFSWVYDPSSGVCSASACPGSFPEGSVGL